MPSLLEIIVVLKLAQQIHKYVKDCFTWYLPQFLAKRTFSRCCHFTYKSSIFIPILTHLVLCVRRNIFGHCVQAHTILQHLPHDFSSLLLHLRRVEVVVVVVEVLVAQ